MGKAPTKYIVEVSLIFFADSHPEHQAVTLVLIIASLYDLNWMQQKIINAIKDQYRAIIFR